jgi:hypothetical protein
MKFLPGLAVLCLAGAFPALAFAAPASDTTIVVVSSDGSGDATTITEGLAMLEDAHVGVLEVMPGFYDEVVQIAGGEGWHVRAPGGPSVTKVRAFAPGSVMSWTIRGFHIVEPVVWKPAYSGSRGMWDDCVFEGGFIGEGSCLTPNIRNSRLSGTVRLSGYSTFYAAFENLHFDGARLQLWTKDAGDCGPLTFIGCTFEGPADTAIVAYTVGENYISFENCTFLDLNYGIVADGGCGDAIRVRRSSFTDITHTAIRLAEPGPTTPACRQIALESSNNRFVRCGQAVQWLPANAEAPVAELTQTPGRNRPLDAMAVADFGSSVSMVADTLIDCGGPAIEVHAQHNGALFRSLVVTGGSGAAVDVRSISNGTIRAGIRVEHSLFAHNAGPAVTIVDDVDVLRDAPVSVIHNRFEHNAGAGLDVTAHDLTVSENVAHHNGGAGFRIHSLGANPATDISLNTSAANDGAGFAHTIDSATPPASVTLHHNLAARNGEAGIGAAGVVRRNAAWMNPAGDFAGGVLEENLSVDPAFCDFDGADYTLISGSACAPAGPFGQIGALGVGCGATLALVALHSATVDDGRVRIEWFAGGTVVTEAIVERNDGTGSWTEVGTIASDGRGMLVFEEPIPAAGRYGYRLTFHASGARVEAGETWIDVRALAMAMRLQNPMPGERFVVHATLPFTELATLDLIDVAGRMIESIRVRPAMTGEQPLAFERAVAPGIYMVRLTQGMERRVARVAVVK